MGLYIYDKLGSSEQLMIRIFVLSVGKDKDPLHRDLETHYLSKVDEEEKSTQRQHGDETCGQLQRTGCSLTTSLQTPQYEAISYRWGSDEYSTVTCSNGSIKINENLDRALKALRYQDKTRRLWIDQICINQNDTDERSHQVQHMRQIYPRAERTVVLLGKDDEKQGSTTKDFFSAFQRMGVVCQSIGYHTTILSGGMGLTELGHAASAEVTFHDEDRRMTVNETGWFPTNDLLEQHDLPDPSHEAWPAFNALLQSSYFTRVWTLQELLSSREAVILWGSTELPWATLRNAYQWATLNGCMTKDGRRGSPGGPSLTSVEFLRLELRWFRGFCDLTLAQLTESCRDGFEATDPRDQIYAFVGLASDGGKFAVDYGKHPIDAFINFAKHRLTAGDLTTLNLAGLYKPQGSWEAQTGREDPPHPTVKILPSWVPSLQSRLRIWPEISSIEKPVVPLVGTVRGSIGWSPDRSSGHGFRTEYRDFSASGVSTARFKKAPRPEQWLVEGFRLAQAKVVCTRQAYNNNNYEDHGWRSMTAQYDELFPACASPSNLQAMICCMTSALQAAESDKDHDPTGNPHYSYDYDELSAQFISFGFNSMLSSPQLLPEEVGGLEMIYLASASMEESAARIESDFSKLTAPAQQDTKSALQRFKRGQLKQDEVDKAIEAIQNHGHSKPLDAEKG